MPLSSFHFLGPSGRTAGGQGRHPNPLLGGDRSGASADPDFDDEAKKIFASLGVTTGGGRFNPCDAIWKHPRTGGTIFVGNVEAASNIEVLNSNKITHVVNCTDNMPLYHQSGGRIQYYRFDIAGHWRHVKDDASAIAFTRPMFEFVGEALSRGDNVLVHCLAGAHRAGTTGCACLMHFGGLDVQQAISVAKKLRPIIDPIGTLPALLHNLHKGYFKSPPNNLYPDRHFK